MNKMLMIETGGVYIVVDTIAALTPHEFNGKTQIMLISGAEIETDEAIPDILDQIAEVMRRAHD